MIVQSRQPPTLHPIFRWYRRDTIGVLGRVSLVFLLTFASLAILTAQGVIEPTASLSLDFQRVRVSGSIACMPGETFDLQVTLQQASSNAEGSGSLLLSCLGGVQGWTLAFAAAGFAPGPARACAVGTLRQEGWVIDSQQWCRNMTVLSWQEIS